MITILIFVIVVLFIALTIGSRNKKQDLTPQIDLLKREKNELQRIIDEQAFFLSSYRNKLDELDMLYPVGSISRADQLDKKIWNAYHDSLAHKRGIYK